jgi:hypothetical protein
VKKLLFVPEKSAKNPFLRRPIIRSIIMMSAVGWPPTVGLWKDTMRGVLNAMEVRVFAGLARRQSYLGTIAVKFVRHVSAVKMMPPTQRLLTS